MTSAEQPNEATVDISELIIKSMVDCAIYMLSPSGTILSWNAGMARLGGYTEEDVLGRHFSFFFSEEDRNAGVPEQALDAALKTGHYKGEGWRVRKDGSRFWAQAIINPITAAAGHRGFANVTRDMTSRKLVEDELRLSKARFENLLQQIEGLALMTLDEAGYITYASPSCHHITGYNPGEMIGMHFSKFQPEDEIWPEFQRAKALSGVMPERHQAKEVWRIRKDGTRFWAYVIVNQITETDGAHIGFSQLIYDLTQTRAAQEMLLHVQKVELIGQLASGIAHDFRNVLQSIIASLEMVIRQSQRGTQARKFSELALKSAIRGSSLTHYLLSFARKQTLQPQSILVRRFLSDLHTLLTRTLNPRVAVMVRVSGAPSVLVDPGQLETALLNLAINASDAMPEGGTLQIKSRTVLEKEQSWVVFSLTDTGVGMDAPTLARAIEPFFTTKGAKGSGLGLPMVYAFAEQSGGHLQISSKSGRGTKIKLSLPSADSYKER